MPKVQTVEIPVTSFEATNTDNLEPLPEIPQRKSSTTPWRAFEKGGLTPLWITCQTYKPVHISDETCHTRLRLHPDNLVRHIAAHSGAFAMKLRYGDKPWPGWKAYEEANLEALDFRCEVCDEKLPFNPVRLAKHMKPHPGKLKKTFLERAALFNMTLSVGIPIESPDEPEFPDETF